MSFEHDKESTAQGKCTVTDNICASGFTTDKGYKGILGVFKEEFQEGKKYTNYGHPHSDSFSLNLGMFPVSAFQRPPLASNLRALRFRLGWASVTV